MVDLPTSNEGAACCWPGAGPASVTVVEAVVAGEPSEARWRGERERIRSHPWTWR